MFILYYFFNGKPHLRAMCTINHLPLYRSHWRWLSQTCYWHLLLPYWMPRSLISSGATWISLWSEHLKQKQIQVEKQPVTACCFITPENTRGKEGDRDAHLLEFNNTFVLQVCFIKHTAILFCNTHAHTSSSYTTCKWMVTITQVCIGGDVCVRVRGQSRKGERQYVCVHPEAVCTVRIHS